jgi:Transglutaminase-like superfamily
MSYYTRDWEVFLRETTDGKPVPVVPLHRRLRAISCAMHALHLLHKQKWNVVCQYLQAIRPQVAIFGPPEEVDTITLARREIAICQVVTRLSEPRAMCLSRSTALAAYLVGLGLPAQVVVARPRLALYNSYAFHAWTELYGTVINDTDEVQRGYVVLQRVPHLQEEK